MKLAIIHNHPIHYKHLLFQELSKAADLEVVFLAGGSQVRHEKIPLSQGLYRYRIGFDGPYESAPAIYKAAFTWRAASEIRPEVMVISGYYAIECWIAWLWARINRRPMVMWFESNEFDYQRRWYKEMLKRIFVRALDNAHVYGLSNKAYLVKLGMQPDSVTIKRAVVDVGKFGRINSTRTYLNGNTRRLIYVGRLAPEKNISFLLRALANANSRMQGATLFLTIAGTGPLEGQLRRECTDLGIERLVEFTGYCPQNELSSLYLKADFMVLPSTREPWGLVALEAMLCGLPVLLSKQCGCAIDLVTPDTGWSFSPNDEEGCAKLLTSLPGVPSERLVEMGKRCRFLASEYSAERSAGRIIDSLEQLLSKQNRNLSVARGAGPESA